MHKRQYVGVGRLAGGRRRNFYRTFTETLLGGEGWKLTNKWWSENQEHWVNGEATSLFVLVTMECRLDGTNTKSIFYIQTMGVPSRIIERIGGSLAVVVHRILGGERMQLEECCVPRFIIANVRAGAFLGACLVI